MPEPTDEILPSLEPEEKTVEEIAKEPQEQGIAPQFFGALLGGVAASFFSRKPTRLEDDKHFREVVEKRVGVWQKSHPDAFNSNIFTKSRRSGQLVINPEIERFIPNLKNLALNDFQVLYPKDAKRYRELEAKRIYSDPQNDPELQKIEAGLDTEVTKAFWSPQQRQPSGQQESNEETKNRIRTERYRELIRKHPEKARYYSRQNPLLKKAYEEHLEAEWVKKGRSGRLLTRLYSPEMIPESQRDAWMPKWMRSRYERYTLRKNAFSDRVSKRYQSSFFGRGINKFNRGFEKTVNTALRPADYVDRKTEQALNYGIDKAFSPFKGIGARMRGFFGKVFSSFAKRMPTITGLALRGALAAKQVIGTALHEGIGGIVRLGGSLLKSGTRYAMRVSARLAAGAAAATMPVWGPYAIAAGVVGFVILLIIIVLIASLQSALAGEVNVDIQKSGPVQINNPVFGQDTFLEYIITVSYSGPVSSITVTDYLPEELEYVPGVSVDAPVQPTVNGNTITWVVPISGSTGSSGTPGTPPNLDTSDFMELMTGQGRNTGILGNENEFVEAVFANVNSGRPLSNRSAYENRVRQIYRAAVGANINPLILLTMWGVEQSFGNPNYAFGCRGGPTSFEDQLSCATETLTRWMNVYDRAAASGTPVTMTEALMGFGLEVETCQFSDPFTFAYEAYTPVCTYPSDPVHSNRSSRENFVAYFKDFMQPGNQ